MSQMYLDTDLAQEMNGKCQDHIKNFFHSCHLSVTLIRAATNVCSAVCVYVHLSVCLQ